MTKTRYGVSYWADRLSSQHRRSYSRHRGHIDVQVAIVGGGLTGCATAYAFAAAGVRVALFETQRIGGAGTLLAAGLALPDPLADFREFRSSYGLKAARHAWQSTRRGVLEFATATRRLRMKADLSMPGALRVAAVPDDAARLHRQLQALREAGVEASWLTSAVVRRETGIPAAGAVRFPSAGYCDPLRACVAFAREAADRGAAIFERSPVLRVRGGRKAVEIKTMRGSAHAEAVVIATGAPTRSFYKPLMRHVRSAERYAVVTPPLPAAVRRETGATAAILLDTARPPHALARLRDERLLFVGAEQAPIAARQRDKVLVQRAGQLMYELSLLYPAISGIRPEYAWHVPIATTRDGLPFIGPHRNYGRHLFALGLGGNVAYAYLSARVLVRRYFGQISKADEVLSFSRVLDKRWEE